MEQPMTPPPTMITWVLFFMESCLQKLSQNYVKPYYTRIFAGMECQKGLVGPTLVVSVSLAEAVDKASLFSCVICAQ
jgi:hypothetical protein